MGDYGHKKKESGVYNTLNMLIYEYLTKMKYEGTAKVFCSETGIGEFKAGEGTPLLAQWYGVFHDISAVRSGLSPNPHDLSRIEGIMMRLENERRRHQYIGRVDGSVGGYGGMREMDLYKQYGMYYQPQQFEARKMYEMYGQMSPGDGGTRFYDPRKGGAEYRGMQGRMMYPRFEEQTGMCSMKMGGRGREERRYVDGGPVVGPQVVEGGAGLEPMCVAGDRSFGLKEIMGFVPNEYSVVCSVVAREHKVLFVSSSNKTVTAVNLLSGKNEAVVETNGSQVIEIKIKEHPEQVVVVCNVGSNELLLMRYCMQGKAGFEIGGVLKGHTAPIVSYEVLDFIHSLDRGGIMRKWSLQGGFEREEVVSGDVVHICCISDDNFMLADSQRVYVYDFELNIEMMEVLRGRASGIKRVDEGFIVVFKNQVVWLDKRMQKVKTLRLGSEEVRTAALIDSDIVVASSHEALFSTGKALNRMKFHETGIVSLNGVNVFRKPSIVSCSAGGECKVWIKYLND